MRVFVLRPVIALALVLLASCGGTPGAGASQSGRGSLGASQDAGSAPDAGLALELCARDACPPPAPESPNVLCADGQVAGPACVRGDDGACRWRVLSCH